MGYQQQASFNLLAKEAKGRPQIFPESSSGSRLQEGPLKHLLLLSEHSPLARTREPTLSCPRIRWCWMWTEHQMPLVPGRTQAWRGKPTCSASVSQGHTQGEVPGSPAAVPRSLYKGRRTTDLPRE